MEINNEDWTIRATPDGSRLRVLLLTSDDPQHAYLRLLLASELDLVATIVEPGAAQKRRLKRNRRHRDLAYRVYQGWRQRVTGRARQRRTYFQELSRGLPHSPSPVHVVDSVNSAEAKELSARLEPDLTVVCGTGILGKQIIERTPGLMVNIHGGWLPEYKGNHGVYFAYLHQDWQHIGATLHLVTPALDAGPILDRVTPAPHPGDSDEQLYARSVHAAALRLTELARGLERGEVISAVPQEDRGTTYRHRDRKPWPEFVLWIRRTTGRHRTPGMLRAPDGSPPHTSSPV
ncbi:formyl transferase [Streptomyces sp. NBC_00654]|uniref:formyl transferase n=1 Tax=Streptomyces sp. NBC_00654 TaxID=2975799 RepID=UPI00224DDCC7|nr:formyl transferase [Streptomyces sp. NBC_00654]MCX4966776.1 formyl transferase [Streptomyces sp. NBC_00654]